MKKIIYTALIGLNMAAVYLNYNVAFAADEVMTKKVKTTYGPNHVKLILKDTSNQINGTYDVQSLTEIDNVLENTHGINDTNRAKILNSIKLAKQRKPNLNLTNHHGKSGVTIRTEKTTNFEDILADKLVNGKYKGIDPQNIVKITKTIKAKDINTLLAHGDLSPAQRDKLQGVLDAKHQSQ